MSKLIIYIDGRPLVQGFIQREFRWSDPHGCYLYESREFEAQEFNAKYQECMRLNGDLMVRVRVVDATDVTLTVSSAPAIAALAPPAVAAVTVTTSGPHVVTLEEAEAVFLKHAPHRLRAKTGPKVSAKAVEV